ncbi:MAG: DUF2271 domain-containing protein, partial [Proteobacteria bacterium]|nr:DUF2271 domain-containing protein [Pseudomonadota bacterium]
SDSPVDPTVDAAPGGTGSLVVTFTSSPTAGGGGQYAPKNVDAVWIEGPTAGVFVKTIGRWAATRKGSLVAWKTAAGVNDADAVSGATQATYATPHTTMAWDLKNIAGTVIPDGTYTVRMESTDLNANTAGQNNQGTFTFVKGPTAQNQTGLTNGGFSNVTITFTP